MAPIVKRRGWMRGLRVASLLGLIVLVGHPAAMRGADPDVLWKIVDGACVPHLMQSGDPGPCDRIEQRPGGGYAVLKDRVGIAQFLVIPTTRLTGIESPALLADGGPNYWADAWRAKAAVEARLPRDLDRDEVALAVNSAYGRTQNQLHIHVDCIRPDVRASLRAQSAEIGPVWAPLRVPLLGHPYWATRIVGADLGANDPFKILAAGRADARAQMDRQTLVVTGARFADGSDGYILLADHADPTTGDRASGEELQDHDCVVAGVPIAR